MITSVGYEQCASHLASDAPGETMLPYLALGTDDTDEAVSDLALGAEIYRGAFTEVAQSGNTVLAKLVVQASDIGAESSYTIKEIGFFDAASGGNCLSRTILDASITLTGSKRIEFLVGWVLEA